MRVVFDFNPVIKTRLSGFNTFGINLLRAFERIDADIELALFYHRGLSAAAEEFRAELSSGKITFHPAGFKLNRLKTVWNYVPFPSLQYFVGRFDVFHSFHNMMPPTRGRPRIITIHDLRRHRCGHYGKPAPANFVKAILQADHLAAISESTRFDLCDIFNISPEKISVVPLACDERLRPLSAEEKAAVRDSFFSGLGCAPAPYLITISSPDRRKNVLKTIKAFRRVKPVLPSGMKLVVAGLPPKDAEEAAGMRAEAEADGDIIACGAVEDLTALMAASEGMIYASLYEGFGIPVLEGFACEIPVLTSDCSSLPEVGGDAAFYCDPEDIDSIAAGITAMFGADRPAKINAGRERRGEFSWEKCARGYLEVYRKVSGGAAR